METDIYREQHRDVSGGSGSGEDIRNKAERAYDETRQAVSHAYEKTTETLGGTYDQAMMYARENPGKTTLIALGIGLGLGLLLASGRRSRIRRFGEPIINAVSDIALEIIRGR
jgi:ElaB protein